MDEKHKIGGSRKRGSDCNTNNLGKYSQTPLFRGFWDGKFRPQNREMGYRGDREIGRQL